MHDIFRELPFSGKYTIQFKGLKDGFHTFELEIDNKFFEFFANKDIERGSVKAEIILEKKPGLLQFNIFLKGTVNVVCDRCLDFFDFTFEFSGSLFVKFTQNMTASGDPDLIFLDTDAYEVDLAQYLYESVTLSLPYRKVHPGGKKAKANCNPEMLAILNKIAVYESKATDPRWDKLKKLRDEL